MDSGTIEFQSGASGTSISAMAAGKTIPHITVDSGAIVTSAYVSGAAAVQQVYGGVASDTVLVSGGQDVRSGGQVYNTSATGSAANVTLTGAGTESYNATVTSGARIDVNGSTIASGSVIGNGGNLNVKKEGSASGTQVSAGGTATVAAQASAADTVVTSGGQFIVSGSATNTQISGGTETVGTSGLESGTSVVSGGTLSVAGGSASSITLSGNTTSAMVQSGGAITSATVGSGASISVDQAATLSNAILQNKASATINGSNVSGTVQNGATLYVGSTGVDSATSVTGAELVSAGGSAVNTSVTSAGYIEFLSGASGSTISALAVGKDIPRIVVDAGATVTSAYVSGAAAVQQVNGGTASNTILVSGGQDVRSGGQVYNTSATGSAANITLTGAGAESYNGQVADGARIVVNSGSVASGSVVSSGGTLTVKQGGTLAGTTLLESGGKATIVPNAGGTIVMDGSTNTGLVISGLGASDVTVTTVISSFDGQSSGNSDGIELAGIKASDISDVSYATDGDHVTLTLQNGHTVTMNIVGVTKSGYSLVQGPNNDVLFEVCFLAGSMISTPSGDVAVEDIRLGDQVTTWDWQRQREVAQSVVWTGKKHMQVRTHCADAEAGYPVRVLKDAITDGVPYKDLLITPEHCLFFENKFIPVRMLVNGRSIFYDRSITSYDYFHIETENHAVIRADGMLTESYLDTGNRSTFRQDGTVVRLGQPDKSKSWVADAAASLNVERAVVEPLFRTLDMRATQAGLMPTMEALPLTEDSDLHLETEAGQIIRAVRQQGSVFTFMLPATVETVRLVSRASRPSDAIGPFVNDRRSLGVLVGKISLFDGKIQKAVENHLVQDELSGWHGLEAALRWTDGNAVLPLGETKRKSLRLLSVEILAAGPYVETDEVSEVTAKMA
ncbi:Hint domain-containing protein [Acetobacter sp. P5B1]|uniref:Hint domain-containing protein n=1 Tax=Acetobacter sp. P5B1 TaxID=2762620 RepID=UPI00207B5A93|nr:Hint domain-containing protein [Acetobacter sp. P5B1]